MPDIGWKFHTRGIRTFWTDGKGEYEGPGYYALSATAKPIGPFATRALALHKLNEAIDEVPSN